MQKLINYTPKQRELILAYLRGAQRLKRHLSRAEMHDLGYNRDSIRLGFSSLARLREEVRKLYPREIDSLVDEQILSPRKSKQLKVELRRHKRFLITTAIDGSPAHKGFLKSIKTFCRRNQAMLLVLPAGKSLKDMDPALAIEQWILEDTYLNSNIWISSIKIPPKTAQPTDRLKRIGQREGSLIAASPKQFLEFVAVGNEKFAHAVMSTGAITLPRYYSRNGDVNQTDYVAHQDHVMGAVIVEVVNDSSYHFRQVQADHNGNFYDLGIYYYGERVKHIAPEGMLWGDLHAGEVDPRAKAANFEIMKLTGVRKIYLGDAFSGISINHHEENSHVTRAILANQNKMNLENELRELCQELNDITAHADEVVIVASNHHDFLSKHYLQKGKYIAEPHNFRIAHKLVDAMMEGVDPLQFACENLIGLKHPEKIRWLKRDEDDKIAGVQMGAHGDKGANGAPGSKRTLENAYGNVMHGHTHSPYIFRGVFCVGTTSILRVGFNEGPSGWVHCSGLVYPNGMRQLINIFDGRWRLKKTRRLLEGSSSE